MGQDQMGCDAEAGAQQASFRTGRRALVLGSLFTLAGCSALKPPKSTQVSAKITTDLSINPAPDGTATPVKPDGRDGPPPRAWRRQRGRGSDQDPVEAGRATGRKRPDILPQPRPSRFS
ncbi:hypothetical protein [Xanthobacter sp. VNH20]|uniref:hypothetical protein n=1 Tax=Xanthobacter sp. VNH20 TaxID=3156616 RepID=UPI0032B4CDD8